MNYVINVLFKANYTPDCPFNLFLLVSKLHDFGPKHDEAFMN